MIKEIFEKYFPNRAIKITVGETQSYLGINSRGLQDLQEKQVEYLLHHKPLHIFLSAKEVEVVYKNSKKYQQIVWG